MDVDFDLSLGFWKTLGKRAVNPDPCHRTPGWGGCH